MAKPLNKEIFNFILANAQEHGGNLAMLTAKEFNVSRTTAGKYIKILVDSDALIGQGNTKSRTYELTSRTLVAEDIEINDTVQEDVIWRERLLPVLRDLPGNVRAICQHGFTEMMNNVIDHSESSKCHIMATRTSIDVTITVEDFGIGIFEKIRKDFGLADRRLKTLERRAMSLPVWKVGRSSFRPDTRKPCRACRHDLGEVAGQPCRESGARVAGVDSRGHYSPQTVKLEGSSGLRPPRNWNGHVQSSAPLQEYS